MATGKSTAKKIEDVDLGEAIDEATAPDVKPARLKQKVVKAVPNSTFAQRAKAANKRVDSVDAVSK